MKRILVGIAAAASMLTTGALAADLPAKVYTKAPIIPPVVYDWTGFYVGGNVGYSWGRSNDLSALTSTAGALLFASTGKFNLDGVIGGGQIGYNWQRQNWVFGLEGDIQGSDEKGGRAFTCDAAICPLQPPPPPPPPPPQTFTAVPLVGAAPAPLPVTVALSQKIEWFGTVRGRIGFLPDPRVLLYATGGLAYGEVKSGVIASEPGSAFGFSNSDTRFGWTVGAGIEGAIGGNWTAKLEYLYMDLGTTSGSFVTSFPAAGGGFIVSNFSSHITDNILRVGVNYRFSGPVLAKY